MKYEIEQIIENIANKLRITPEGAEKTAKLMRNESVGKLPLIFWKPSKNYSVPGITYNLSEQFHDREKMLYGQLEEIADCVHNVFDASLCVRVNLGVILVPAVAGAEFEICEDKYPWISSYISKKEFAKLEFPDLDKSGVLNMTIEYMQYFRETLPEWIHIYLPDTQGPFDIAHLIYGDSIFYDLYDDPGFVHSLLDFSTKLYIEISQMLKKTIDEPLEKCFHGHALSRGFYMDNGGVRISEDTATLLSPAQIDEFVIPYDEKVLREFGGGFVHFCGKNDYLLESFLNMEDVRAVNFGNPEMYEFNRTMKLFRNSNKCCFGVWPKERDETLNQYLYRMSEASEHGSKHMLLHFDENMFPDIAPSGILDLWNNFRP